MDTSDGPNSDLLNLVQEVLCVVGIDSNLGQSSVESRLLSQLLFSKFFHPSPYLWVVGEGRGVSGRWRVARKLIALRLGVVVCKEPGEHFPAFLAKLRHR